MTKTTQPREQAAIDLVTLPRTVLDSALDALRNAQMFKVSTALAKAVAPVAAPEAPTLDHQLWELQKSFAGNIKAERAIAICRDFASHSPIVPEVAASEQQTREPICGMCNDSGIVGYPPDQYEECPDCIKARAATTASASIGNDPEFRGLLDVFLRSAAQGMHDAALTKLVACINRRAPVPSPAASASGEMDEALACYVRAIQEATVPDNERVRLAKQEIIDLFNRATAPSRNAAPLSKSAIDAIVYQCRQSGDDSTYAIVSAALTQQSAAQAPIRQVQQAGFPSAWCDVSEAEFDTCTSAKRIVYAAQASHAGADTEPAEDPVVEANRKLLLERSRVGVNKYGVTLADAGLSRGQLAQHALEEALDLANYLQTIIQADRAAMSAATEQKEKK